MKEVHMDDIKKWAELQKFLLKSLVYPILQGRGPLPQLMLCASP